MDLVIVLVVVVALLVLATTKAKLHPFLALLLAAYLAGFGFRLDLADITTTIAEGFGGILGGIGLVIALGTVIGVILERSGAAFTMADTVVKVLGNRFPTLAVSIIGWIVSIPVFCDSGYVILNSLKESLAERMKVSFVAMSVALATGLYATHTFVPPTPGPIAAAGNLGLEDNLGLVILVGIPVSIVTALAGLLWANRFKNVDPDGEGAGDLLAAQQDFEEQKAHYGTLPGPLKAFSPILVPIILICIGSVANLPAAPFGEGTLLDILAFLGQPLTALLIGVAAALPLLSGSHRLDDFRTNVTDGITAAAPILLITGAGGAFGAIIQATDLGDYLGDNLSQLGLGVLMPFLVAAALKSAQGSSTVALVTTSAIVAPLLGDLGLSSDMGRVLTVMAIGAGAMTVSHANDSYFWVVTQFSKMSVSQGYRAQTMATLIQGVTGIVLVWLLALVLV